MSLLSSSYTHIGLRRQTNADRLFADDKLGLYAVADGMGGHRSGEEAAQSTVDTFAAIARNSSLQAAACAANVAVLAIEGGVSYRSPGSTLTAIRILNGKAEVIHAGDSEAFLWRGGRISKLTRDGDYRREGPSPVFAGGRGAA